MTKQLDVSQAEIEAFCQRNRIRRLAFFGSVLREDFTSQSDVDVLVVFEPEARVGLITLAGMEIELSEILGRRASSSVSGRGPGCRGSAI